MKLHTGIDWSQNKHDVCFLNPSGGTGHIFFNLFYYVEYGVTQLGAIQVWENSRNDYKKAVQSFRKALALGNTASLPDLFHTAGAKFSFDLNSL